MANDGLSLSERRIVIARMLAEGHHTAVIAKELGCTERTVQNHKQARRKAASQAAAQVVAEAQQATAVAAAVAEPEPVEAEEIPEHRLPGVAYALGMRAMEIAAVLGVDESTAIQAIGANAKEEALRARIAALARLRAEKPDKWIALMDERETEERKAREATALDYSEFQEFFGDVARHQATLLGEAAMGEWLRWVKELTQNRYPKFA